jgi:predicted dehydrogenase
VNRVYSLGIIGADARTRALAGRLSPSAPFHAGPFAIRRWAGSPAGGDGEEAAAQAMAASVSLASSWRDALDADAVFVAGPAAGHAQAVVAALSAGRPVLCPLPLGVSASELAEVEAARRGSGAVLLSPSDLSASTAGRRALESVRAGELGQLHAVFLASRTGPAAGDVLDDLGWEALDFLAACVAAPCTRVYATGGSLFGAPGDALLANLRFAGDTIVTLELSRGLPPALAAAGPEVEIELAGVEAALRVEPYRRTVAVYRGAGAERRHWPARPVVAMLEDLQAAMKGTAGPADGDVIARQRAALAMHTALRASLSGRDVVPIAV